MSSNPAIEKVLATILSKLDSGIIPWRRPWKCQGSSLMPYNMLSGKPYRGVNVILLGFLQGYSDSRWLSFKQAKALGGNVKKGEKATTILFCSPIKQKQASGEEKEIFVWRNWSVFNFEQCEGIGKQESPLPTPSLPSTFTDFLRAIEPSPIIKHGSNKAFYRPSEDSVSMPNVEAFDSVEHYQATLFHELGHWTGHTSRLNREFGEHFGNETYSREELIAEITSAFLCAHMGIDNIAITDNSIAYLQGWKKYLTNDPSAILKACNGAQKAFDYLTRTKQEEDTN